VEGAKKFQADWACIRQKNKCKNVSGMSGGNEAGELKGIVACPSSFFFFFPAIIEYLRLGHL
jgi:hypothetical protein